MGVTLRRLWVFWRCRTYWDGPFFYVTVDDWTLYCLLEQIRWRLRRGGPARISFVTICRFYRGVPVRVIVIVYCRGFFSPCRWATTLMRTESARWHTRVIGVRNRKSSCVISDSLSFWFLQDVAFGWWHFDITSSPFRRVPEWTASCAVYKSDWWSLPQIWSRHIVRRCRLLVLVMLVLPWNDVGQNFRVAPVEDAVYGHSTIVLVYYPEDMGT